MGRMKTPAFVDDIRQFPKIMTPAQVAAYLQVSDRTVRTLAESGALPAKKVGDQWRFVREEIRDMMEASHA